LESIKNEVKLPTPLNIKDFASETADIITRDILEKKLDEISQRTSERFAKDIIEMEKRGDANKILFLCFPFISNWLSYDFVKNQYNKLLKNFNIKDDYVFERASAEFQDKVAYSDYIRFSHPSYSEALPFILLDENGIPTKINTEIFSKVLIRLSDINRDTRIARDLSKTLSENFDKLPEKVRNGLLIKLADNNEKVLKEYEGTEILADEYPVRFIASAIAKNFDKLPENVQNLLFKLKDSKHSGLGIASAIAENFDKLPENVVQDLLFKLADKEQMSSYLVFSYMPSNFDKLPEKVRNELLIKLADKKEEAIFVASIVADNFDKLPENVQNLLFKLADNKETAPAISYAVADNFDKLPDKIRYELLIKLAGNKETASYVADTLSKNFDKISDNVRNLLFKILPENIRNQMLRKLEKE
jgi:hypothetical protein